MQVRLTGLKQPMKFINSIKAVRLAVSPLLSLKEAKDLVERMRDDSSYRPAVEIMPEDQLTSELGRYFTFEKLNKLKLYIVTTSEQHHLVLAMNADEATKSAITADVSIQPRPRPELVTVQNVWEVHGPFVNGTILVTGRSMAANRALLTPLP
jgi:hypothetical protein